MKMVDRAEVERIGISISKRDTSTPVRRHHFFTEVLFNNKTRVSRAYRRERRVSTAELSMQLAL